ncbi:MAG: glutamate racemase [Deltaproteobacteria bacterium]|nr:glutamate racemase [Deltaproteobacteria bacterium]
MTTSIERPHLLDKKSSIGVFDSGIGGLTVLREITRLLPGENTIYLGDTARVPYGSKSKETIERYSFEIAAFLLKHDIKMLVAACNTASAYAVPKLAKELDIPVLGVIEPGARAAVAATKANRIGVIGTEGTIKSNSYVNAIKRLCDGGVLDIVEHGKKSFDRYFEVKPGSDVVIFTKACPLFVPLVEEGWTDDAVTRIVVERYLTGLKDEGIDTLVLGCTHYPLLKETIASLMGEAVTLVDSAASTALEVQRVLGEKGILNNSGAEALHKFFVTDSPERFMAVGRRFFGERLASAELAALSDN